MPRCLPLFGVNDCSEVYSLHIENHTFNSCESFKPALTTFAEVIELKFFTIFRKAGAYIEFAHPKWIRTQTPFEAQSSLLDVRTLWTASFHVHTRRLEHEKGVPFYF